MTLRDFADVVGLICTVAGTVSVWEFMMARRDTRLGVEFRLDLPPNIVRVNKGPRTRRGSVRIVPRGPGQRFDVYVTAWPAPAITILDAEGKRIPSSRAEVVKRWGCGSDPLEFDFKVNEDVGTPAWVGVVWEEPALFGGFKPGGWRVRVDFNEDHGHQRWSPLFKRWVPTSLWPAREPKKHPIYGSATHPAATRD